MQALRIIFMGTPEFAVPSLQILTTNGLNVVAAITATDKPKGRGKKLAISPVKEYCLQNSIPVLQPKNLKDEEFIEELKSYNANLQVVVAFRMLPEVIWDMPAIGTFNLHASLLPNYRGAAPINWAIINGEQETGVTTFFLKHEIDTGNIIFQEREPIYENDDAGSLYKRLMEKGAKLVLKTVKDIAADNYSTQIQDLSVEIKHAPKIFKENCGINWNQPARSIHNFVRGLAPYPTAWCQINGKLFKIFKTKIVTESAENTSPGDYHIIDNKHLYIQTRDGRLSIEELQLQGKKRMNIEEFLRGNKL